jgi:hypothetical protein
MCMDPRLMAAFPSKHPAPWEKRSQKCFSEAQPPPPDDEGKRLLMAPPLCGYRSGNHGRPRCWTCHHHHRNARDGLHKHDQHQACRHAVRCGLQVEHNAAARLLRPHPHGWDVPLGMHPVRPPLCAGTFHLPAHLPGPDDSRIVCPALIHSPGTKHQTRPSNSRARTTGCPVQAAGMFIGELLCIFAFKASMLFAFSKDNSRGGGGRVCLVLFFLFCGFSAIQLSRQCIPLVALRCCTCCAAPPGGVNISSFKMTIRMLQPL